MPPEPLPILLLADAVLFPGVIVPFTEALDPADPQDADFPIPVREVAVCRVCSDRRSEGETGPAEPCDVGTLAIRLGPMTSKDSPPGLQGVVYLRGNHRVRLVRRWHDGETWQAETAPLEDVPTEPAVPDLARQLAGLATQYQEIVHRASGQPQPSLALPEDPDELTWSVAAAFASDSAWQQRLLETTSLQQRLEATIARLHDRLTTITYRVENAESIHRITSGNGHLPHRLDLGEEAP